MRALPLCIWLLLLSFAQSDQCPSGYTQGTVGGDCYMTINFYNSLTGYAPTTYDFAEYTCNQYGGGLLTSIHYEEENQYIHKLNAPLSADIGLRCKGLLCKWDDGSPVTYTNFLEGQGPKNDSTTRCFMMDLTVPSDGTWRERGCGTQYGDNYVCRVKGKTIDCLYGETEYKGGCVSVHTTPLDANSAEASCPGGGHLVSIHSITENNVFKQIALDGGLNGTMYIGGQFPLGVFAWNDGSYYGTSNWANTFPNIYYGLCAQMLLASEFGVQGQWTNVDCSAKQPYLCFRDGADYDPNDAPPWPKADKTCPSMPYFHDNGTIYSPNFPLSIPSGQTCDYKIGVEDPSIGPMFGKRASVRFTSYNCTKGTTLTMYDGLDSDIPFATLTSTAPPPDQVFLAETNWIRIYFESDEVTEGTGWQVEYAGVKRR